MYVLTRREAAEFADRIFRQWPELRQNRPEIYPRVAVYDMTIMQQRFGALFTIIDPIIIRSDTGQCYCFFLLSVWIWPLICCMSSKVLVCVLCVCVCVSVLLLRWSSWSWWTFAQDATTRNTERVRIARKACFNKTPGHWIWFEDPILWTARSRPLRTQSRNLLPKPLPL